MTTSHPRGLRRTRTRLLPALALSLAPVLALGACASSGEDSAQEAPPAPTVEVTIPADLPAELGVVRADPLFLVGEESTNSAGNELVVEPLLVLHTAATTPGVVNVDLTFQADGEDIGQATPRQVAVPAGEATVLVPISSYTLKLENKRSTVTGATLVVDRFVPEPNVVIPSDLRATVDTEAGNGLPVRITGTVDGPLVGDPDTISMRVFAQCTDSNGEFLASGNGSVSRTNASGPIAVPFEIDSQIAMNPGEAMPADAICLGWVNVQHPKALFE